MNNWLVNPGPLNPTGKPNAWVPVDLMQEHMNFWIKVIYKAQGSNASWDWLRTVSPCIALLRNIALQMNSTLGAQLGTKHQAPDKARDLATLQDSLREHKVFTIRPGRVLRGVREGEVPNVMSAGLNQLQTPLNEYNKTFKQLQKRRREVPLAATVPELSECDPPLGSDDVTVPEPSPESEAVAVVLSQNTDMCADDDADDTWFQDEDAEYWDAVEQDLYEPREVFADDEEGFDEVGDL